MQCGEELLFTQLKYFTKKIVQILVLQMMKGARTVEISFHTKRRKGLKYHSDTFTADKKIWNDFNNRHTLNYEQFSTMKTLMSHLWIFP